MRFALPFLAIAAANLAHAQFSGPAPLAWRWAQQTTSSPRGNLATDGSKIFAAIGNRIYAIDRESGNQKWRYPAAEPLAASFNSGAVFANGVVIAAADNKTVFAVDSTSGQSKWQYNAPANVVGVPLVVGKYVVLALGDSSLMALWAENGQPAWNSPQRIFDGIKGSLSVYRDNILFFTTASELICLNVGSQNKVWGRRFSQVGGDVKPVVFGDSIYINSANYLIKLGAGDGARQFEKQTSDTLARNPAVGERGIATLTRDGLLLAFDMNGTALYSKPTDLESGPAADPIIDGNWISIPTVNGNVALVDFKTGQLKWNYNIRPFVKTAPAQGESARPPVIQAASAPFVVGDSLLVLARDGSILNFDAKNGVDLTPPEVTLAWPNAGDQINARPPIDFYFNVMDEASGIDPKSIKVDINGKDYEAKFNREGYLVVSIRSSGKNLPLMDGRTTISVTAADWLGNSTTQKFLLTVDSTLAPSRPKAADDNSGNRGGNRGGRSGEGG